MPRIYNIKTKNIPKEAVLIDRTTEWGNPFRIYHDGTRDQVCDKFENLVRVWKETGHPTYKKALQLLKGKDLVCHCFPERCHGETWLRVVNS